MLFGIGEECPLELEEGGSIVMAGGSFFTFFKMDYLFDEDVEAFMRGSAEVSLCQVDQQHVFFTYSIKGLLRRTDMAFTIYKTQNKLKELYEDIAACTGYPFFIFLVDKDTNIIKAQRVLVINTEMSKTVNKVLTEQYNAGIDVNYEDSIKRIWRDNSSDMLHSKYVVATTKFE